MLIYTWAIDVCVYTLLLDMIIYIYIDMIYIYHACVCDKVDLRYRYVAIAFWHGSPVSWACRTH